MLARSHPKAAALLIDARTRFRVGLSQAAS